MPDDFKSDLGRIGVGSTGLQIVEQAEPASRGWLRRPEFDAGSIEAWEHPDGRMMGIRRARRRPRREPGA